MAPALLLTGVGAMLGVMNSRLGRTVDRFRQLGEIGLDKHNREMAVLPQRARWIHWAISLCTLCALFISVSIVALFVGVELSIDLSDVVAMLFAVAMWLWSADCCAFCAKSLWKPASSTSANTETTPDYQRSFDIYHVLRLDSFVADNENDRVSLG